MLAFRVIAIALLFAPVAWVAALSFASDDGPTVRAYLDAVEPGGLPLLGRTAAVALGACVVALLAGGGAAAAFDGRRFPLPGLLRAAALAPLVIAPVLQVAAWERLAAPGGVLAAIFSFALDEGAPFPIRNAPFAACLLGLGYSPFLFFFISEGLRSIPRELVDAARVTRSPWAVKCGVVFPLCLPAAIAGLGTMFPLAFLNYEVPRLLDVNTYPVLIRVEYGADAEPGRAFAAASPGFLLTLAVLIPALAWADRRGFALAGREPGDRGAAPRRRAGPLAWAIFGLWWGLVAALPLATLASMTGGSRRAIEALLTDGEKLAWGGLTSTTAALASAALAAFLLLPPRPPRARRAGFAVLLAFPGALLAYGLIRICRHGVLFELYDSWLILAAADVLRFFPLAYFALAAHLRAVPEAEWSAAALLPGRGRRWLRVRLPLAARGLTAGAVAVLLFSSQELSATLLLAPPGHEPLMVRIFNLIHYDPERDLLAALSLWHVAAVLALAGAITAAGRLSASSGARGPRRSSRARR
jgi:iron(III) transport system permease protein